MTDYLQRLAEMGQVGEVANPALPSLGSIESPIIRSDPRLEIFPDAVIPAQPPTIERSHTIPQRGIEPDPPRRESRHQPAWEPPPVDQRRTHDRAEPADADYREKSATEVAGHGETAKIEDSDRQTVHTLQSLVEADPWSEPSNPVAAEVTASAEKRNPDIAADSDTEVRTIERHYLESLDAAPSFGDQNSQEKVIERREVMKHDGPIPLAAPVDLAIAELVSAPDHDSPMVAAPDSPEHEALVVTTAEPREIPIVHLPPAATPEPPAERVIEKVIERHIVETSPDKSPAAPIPSTASEASVIGPIGRIGGSWKSWQYRRV